MFQEWHEAVPFRTCYAAVQYHVGPGDVLHSYHRSIA